MKCIQIHVSKNIYPSICLSKNNHSSSRGPLYSPESLMCIRANPDNSSSAASDTLRSAFHVEISRWQTKYVARTNRACALSVMCHQIEKMLFKCVLTGYTIQGVVKTTQLWSQKHIWTISWKHTEMIVSRHTKQHMVKQGVKIINGEGNTIHNHINKITFPYRNT